MTARIISETEKQVKIELVIDKCDCMLTGEEHIQSALNEAGVLATGCLLKHFDSDGTAIVVGKEKLTSKGLFGKTYQTPYGVTKVERHLYQSSSGGATYCPLENKARIVVTSTPMFAQQLSCKYSLLGAPQVVEDLSMNHNRHVTKALVQRTANEVAGIFQEKEPTWNFDVPVPEDKAVSTISVGLDGAHMQMCEEGWREAMVGTVALYDESGERFHTQYVASPPEYGKGTFLEKLKKEIIRTKQTYPERMVVGLADGAKSNWEFLEEHTDWQIIDFYHVSEYVAGASEAIFSKQSEIKEKEEWYESALERLKDEKHGAKSLLAELEAIKPTISNRIANEKLTAAITYFKNNYKRMNYFESLELDLPIGSGVTEAGAKVIIKERFCQSGMRWKTEGARTVMNLRCLVKTKERWQQFWNKVKRYGLPARTC